MERNQIDKEQLYNDLRQLETKIKEVKAPLRSTWPDDINAMGKLQWNLVVLKKESTERYVLQAWLHGKQHLADKEKNDELLERIALRYMLDEAA